jgi:hypothetical protein
MSSDQAHTERFHDAWLPPVETSAELPRRPPPEAMCFVSSERRVWVALDGVWTPVGASRRKD